MKNLRSIFGGISASITLAFLRVTTSTAQSDSVRSGMQAAHGAGQPIELFGEGAIFATFVDLLLFLVGAVAVIMIIFGGFRYIISGGNAASVTAAKNTILYAIVGVIIALLAYAVIDFVIGTFEGGGTAGL